MCLNFIKNKDLNITGIGWKVLNERNGKLYGEFYHKTLPYKLNRWEKATNEILRINSFQTYPSGFHIFVEKKDDERWCFSLTGQIIKKVKYRKGHTLGSQTEDNIIVAEEMLIIPKQENKKCLKNT